VPPDRQKGGDQLFAGFSYPRGNGALGKRKISARRSKLFAEQYLPQVTGFANVRSLFQRIIDDGKKIALASSAEGRELEAYKGALAQILRSD